MTENTNIATLVTIIFGLMLTDLFASVHRLIRNNRRIRWHWLPLLVAWYVFAMVLKNWWGLVFDEGDGNWGSGWIFFFYGHLLLMLYLVVSAVLPDEIPADGLDLREYYFDNRRRFWGPMAGVNLTLLVFVLLRPLFTEVPIHWPAVVSNVLMGGVCLSLAKVGRARYHTVVVILLVVLIVLEIVGKF